MPIELKSGEGANLTVIRTARMRWRRAVAGGAVILVVASATACSTVSSGGTNASSRNPAAAGSARSPLQYLVRASKDLGPSHADDVDALVTLPHGDRPDSLYRWAAAHRLHVTWQAPHAYALVRGAAAAMSDGFGVAVHDYRSRSGTAFYATTKNASVPSALRGVITGVGTISSYVPKVTRASLGGYADVPNGGLTPSQLARVYDATPLVQQGDTGKGKTIVFFEIDGYKQADLDAYSHQTGLAPLTPVLDTEQPGQPGLESPMDLEVAHALVPDAKLVVYDVKLHGNSFAEVSQGIAQMYASVDQKYPGAIWSISLGISCETKFALADLQPSQAALQQAESHGTSVFVSSGDTGSLECKGAADYGSPPVQADVGLNALAGPPAITVVGGTALSTDANGSWLAEQAWSEPAVQQGTSGGPSSRFPRPSWQQATGITTLAGNTFRMTPDVSADADPATGVRIYADGEWQQGGGTSQAAPIWAALAVMMNQYLEAHGGHALGDINPLLYKAATSSPGAFHDVRLGANSVSSAGIGFDYTTGLGTPDVAVLVAALRTAQEGSA